MRSTFILTILLTILLGMPAPTQAQGPRSTSFQGFLTNAGGTPINGTQDLTIRLFDASTLGIQGWIRVYPSVSVNQGVFNLVLEDGNPQFGGLAFNDSLWLEVTAGAEVISPRVPLQASPFAMGLSLPIDARGSVGATDAAAFRVTNTATSNENYAIFAETHSGNGIGVLGLNSTTSGGNIGVSGLSYSSSGLGVNGFAKSATGTTYGVYGQSQSDAGTGTFGWATASTGITYGVSGTAESTSGTGVAGEVKSFTGSTRGVSGLVHSSSGYGVWGRAASNTGSTYGVYGESKSISGSGVIGLASAATGSPSGVEGLVTSGAAFAGLFRGGQGTYTRGATNDSPDLILGGSSSTFDDGRIFSDPAYSGSDIWLHSNDAVVIQLDYDASGEDADFEIRNNADVIIFNVDDGGFTGIGTSAATYPLRVGTDGTNGNGAHLTVGGAWTAGSSRTFKEDLRPVDLGAALQAVVDLPLYRWRYKDSDEGDHMGPVAEDFFSAFALGDDERYISGVDGDGVALAAIQGLYGLIQELQAENAHMRAVIERAGLH